MKEETIVIQGLNKSFCAKGSPLKTTALKEINLTVHRGDIYGIIGMSGAGKSTLIRCLSCLERPTEGKIWIEKEEITSLSGSYLRNARKNIGMIFQHFNLFSSRTALENIMYPLEIAGVEKKKRVEKAKELLKFVGLDGKENAYPDQLSGGEKQRVAIARALANEPSVLLCDEATSALDPRTTSQILELLLKLNQTFKLTIVIITHEMEVIKQICSRVAILEHGEIVEEGPVAELFASPSHPTTKRFLQNLVHEIPPHFLIPKEGKEILRLTFRGKGAGKPIISNLLKHHPVEINILLGGIDVLKEETVGKLIVELSGTLHARGEAKLFLENQGVHYEMIHP